VAAHAAGGCITSVASGGACGSGAASAAFGKFTTIAIGDLQGDFAKGVASTVAGGVGSVIAGGKFENGAVTGAFGYLFNYCSSGGKCTTAFEQAMHDWWPGYKLGTCVSNGDCSGGQYAIAAGAAAFDVALGVQSKGIAVLGHYPGYTQLADRLGAEVFDVGGKWVTMNTGERWAANRAFLDSGIERGISFVLATDLRAGMSYFRAEVQYLLKNGYEYGTTNGVKALVKKP
jgi:hypothetical protein